MAQLDPGACAGFQIAGQGVLMREMLCFAAIVLPLVGCASVDAPDSSIVVDGSARLEFVPDQFSVSASFRTRNPDQAAGLVELSDSLIRARSAVTRLAGLEDIQFEASDMELKAVQEAQCLRMSDYDAGGACPITGRFGSIDITITGRPSHLAGNAISILSEVGAESVELGGYVLVDPNRAQRETLEAAVEDARSKAAAIAAASGGQVGDLIKIQYGAGFTADRYAGVENPFSVMVLDAPNQVVTESTVQPATELSLEPRPVVFQTRVVAEFAIQ